MRHLTILLLFTLFACQNQETEVKNNTNQTATNNMKRLGLIGGTSWHSTIEYYRYINESVNEHFGNNTNPPLMVFTMNQAQVHKYQIENNWEGIADMLAEGGKRLQLALSLIHI